MTTLRVGVSGTGPAARHAVAAVRQHDDCDLIAVHAADAATAARFANDHRLGFATGDFAALLAYGIDFVLLTGPVRERLAQVQLAAEQGVPCLVAAPWAADLDSARSMVAAVAAGGTRLGVLVPALGDPVFEQLRRMLVDDWLGAPVALQVLAGDGALLADPRATPDVGDAFFAVLGPPLHLASWLLGRSATAVTAQVTRTFRPDLADAAAATLVLRGGAVGSLVGSRMARADTFAVHGTHGGLRLAGDRLWLVGRKAHHGPVFDYLVPGREVSIGRDELAAAIAAAAPRSEPCGRFARWLEDTDAFPCPAEQALADLEVIDAMRRAAISGRCEAAS
ncbi:MAG: Gfo/Idh/MocA family oxidoreductase [Planctomycetes bacterium]|nr:Gfo/Idh/MocA family oxidoreductase [Planctomycetota bacterium]